MTMIRNVVLWAGVLALTHTGTLAAGGGDPKGAASQQDRYGYSARFDPLTGTYELDRTRSDDPRRAAEDALRTVPAGERSAVMTRVMNRMEAPEVLAVERRGTRVSVASTRLPEMTFDADGRAREERTVNGQRMSTRATLYGDRLEVSATGSNGSDFSATFEPIDNGAALRVTRRLFDERVRQPIVMQSVYRRISDTPDWDVYADAAGSRSRESSYSSYDSAVVPEGVTLVARLDEAIDLRNARPNDRITLTVEDAPQANLNGAVLEGYLLDTPASSANGQEGVTMEFDTIRLRSGQSAPFAGDIQAVRGPNGENISYNGERVEANPDQKQQAIERGAVGAALGALIGAVAGGTKGAVVGAVLGGGGAAATVYLPIDQLNQRTLARGTEFTIRTRAADRR